MGINRDVNWLPIISVLMMLTLLALLLAAVTTCNGAEPPLGSVYVTRNLDWRLNSGWSFWNHQALYVGDTDGDGIGEVIESQSGPPYGYGVLRTPLNQFLSRPYQAVLFVPRVPYIGQRAAAIATTYVGRPYRPYSSVFPHLIPRIVPTLLRGTPYGMNCISVVRDSYEAASGRVLVGYQDPDGIYHFGDLFFGPYSVPSGGQVP